MKIAIASVNPVKINSTRKAFEVVFPKNKILVKNMEVSSGVSAQPMSDRETLEGAKNRSRNLKRKMPTADYWVGIEGGIEERNGGMELFAWVYILSNKGKTGHARTAAFFLPKKHIRLIHKGIELGIVDDIVFGISDTKSKMGVVGNLTRNIIDRTEYYRHTVILALIPFINQKLY